MTMIASRPAKTAWIDGHWPGWKSACPNRSDKTVRALPNESDVRDMPGAFAESAPGVKLNCYEVRLLRHRSPWTRATRGARARRAWAARGRCAWRRDVPRHF